MSNIITIYNIDTYNRPEINTTEIIYLFVMNEGEQFFSIALSSIQHS